MGKTTSINRTLWFFVSLYSSIVYTNATSTCALHRMACINTNSIDNEKEYGGAAKIWP